MKNFEKNLLTIQSSAKQAYFENTFLSDEGLNISHEQLVYLEAKGLIKLSPLTYDTFRIDLTSSGITYFDDKKEARKKIILSWSFDFSMAVLSAVCGSVLTLFIQHVLMK